jgi:RHS repeat-associated protein
VGLARADDSVPPRVFFYHPDHLGSTNVSTDAQGNLVSEFAYYPYGETRHEHHAGDEFDPHYLFAGSERDDESGLLALGARYYAANIGRFISFDNWADKVEVTGAYAYARNNPLRYIDPTGMDPTERDDDSSESAADPEPVGEIVNDTVDAVPGVIQATNQKAQGIAVSKGAAMNDPDPDKRTEAAEAFAGDVGSAAGEIGAEKGWEVIDENTGWGFKVPLIIGYAGVAIGLAFDDTDLPTPIPKITFSVAGGTVALSPKLDLTTITVAGDDPTQYVYVPGMGMGLSYSTGIFSRSVSGSMTPGADGVSSVTGSVGFGVNTGAVNFGVSASGTPEQSYSVNSTLTIKTP